MIGDEDQSIAKAWGVKWPVFGIARRATFVVDEQRVVRGVFKSELEAARHVREAVALLEAIGARPV